MKSVVSTSSDSAVFPAGFAYRYNRANQRIRATAWDRSYWSYRYDALGQVTSGKKNWPEDLPVPGQQYEYGYDDIGNRTAVAFGGDENGVNLRSASYTANALNQYSSRSNPASVDIIGLAEVGSSVTVNGSGADYRHGEYFQKDLGVTNNTFAAITVAAGTNSLSGNLYIPPASESYSYDADGNLIADGRWSYLWDAENRLIEMRPQTNAPSAAKMWLKFEYDYLGRRIQKTAAQWTNSAWSLVVSNRFLYDGWNAIAELNATNNTLIRGYLWGIDLSGSLQGAGGVGGLIAVKEGSGDAHFAAYDGNGNVIALVNATTGTYSAQYEYDPFGQTIRATGPMAEFNPYHFSTKYQDEESGFYYYGYRYYNPSTGRWLSRDPIGEIAFQLLNKRNVRFQNGNTYYFIGNNSLRKIDKLGLDVWTENTTAVGGWHRRICVDVWDRCCSKKIGKYCISFGVDGAGTGSGSGGSPNQPSAPSSERGGSSDSGGSSEKVGISDPSNKSNIDNGNGSTGDGVVYEDIDDPATKQKQRLKTRCAQDKAVLIRMRNMIDRRGNFNICTQSCRDFSDGLIDQIGDEIVDGNLPNIIPLEGIPND